MALFFKKLTEGARTLAKRPSFSKDPRQLQFQADINRLFLYSSYNRLGETAHVEQIIEMANNASFDDQHMQVQQNVHSQIQAFCHFMDQILLPNKNMLNHSSQQMNTWPHRSGLSFAVGTSNTPINPDVPQTRPLSQAEVSRKLKDQLGYTLDIKSSQIPHKDAGRGLFLDGAADVGSVIAFYPGVIYSPAFYRYIPGYPKVDAQNPYLITRYDGNVINGQPWGSGGEVREPWNGRIMGEIKPDVKGAEKGSEKFWKLLSKPLEGNNLGSKNEILERRNPLALAHFANHPPKGVQPNVMICPYDFPLTEDNMRVYIPNVMFGNGEVNMRRFGSFWFKSGVSRRNASSTNVPTLKTLVLVATRALEDEEVLLNYRLSNTKRRPQWYTPVDEEEDKRRWS
ncbi:hypothetical protein PIB30_118468 [Stylosanthes scabra]|uniref:SET domain-containing protein n=1 Tax=Stylosanthes scabra TaxID=79078 RepID=A0ABU6Z895_9FABA|nr:hypothetical protein [Stylosanthes scabra]